MPVSRKPAPKPKLRAKRHQSARPLALFVATRKGAFVLRSDAARKRWTLSEPLQLGCVVHHVVQDPRDPRAFLMAVKTGHLGPTILRSADRGKTWTESTRPPAFPKAPEGTEGKAVEFTGWLTPSHASEPGTWYAGVAPHGLFRSRDGGDTWEGVEGFNRGVVEDPVISKYFGAVPESGFVHSILVDPRAAAHLYLGVSVGGSFESRDAGATWTPLNLGVAGFTPEKDPLYGHDPHCMAMHPLMPDRLWQQNHCGIYRLDRPGERWTRVGQAMPKDVGDIGFPIVLHPRDPDSAWVIPMDGTSVWPRTSPGGRPAVYRTSDAGISWQRQDRGLPKRAWFTVKRQAFAADIGDQLGLYFGTTSGEVWASRDEGRAWTQIAAHLPHIYAVTVATL